MKTQSPSKSKLGSFSIPKREDVRDHFDEIAKNYDYWKKKNAYYYQNIQTLITRTVRPNSRVLEVGCGTGDILACTKPSRGLGVDLSPAMVEIASRKHPDLEFVAASIESFKSSEKFDYILMVDVVDHVYDIMDVFASVYRLCHPGTKIILTTINPWWDPILMFMEKIGAKMPEGPHNFIEKGNIQKMLELMDFSVSYSGFMLLFPKYIPIFSYLANTIGVRIWGLNRCSAAQYMIVEPLPENTVDLGLGCSVIIPCHNEEKNIEEGIRRIPAMGRHTEIIVVNDGSTDKTVEKVKELQKEFANLRLIDYSSNKGKGYAVKQGFEAATQEVLMIMDADLTVAPEELPRFFDPLNQGRCQFVNGSRMVYPMEKQAMRTLNLFGNKVFSLVMTFITGQHLTDTLCGTKALYKKDFAYIEMGLDKWGDFDLLFGAVKLGNKIMEVPVHYKLRQAGQSKMKTFQHALHLLVSCFWGFRKVVFRSTHKSKRVSS